MLGDPINILLQPNQISEKSDKKWTFQLISTIRRIFLFFGQLWRLITQLWGPNSKKEKCQVIRTAFLYNQTKFQKNWLKNETSSWYLRFVVFGCSKSLISIIYRCSLYDVIQTTVGNIWVCCFPRFITSLQNFIWKFAGCSISVNNYIVKKILYNQVW